MKYREIIGNVYNGLSAREPLEWSNFWIDSANTKTQKRYLLIGDSTMRMIRSTLAKETKCPVDMIGTSSILDDILFVNQIDAFFDSTLYKYDTIFIQLGHHGRISKDGTKFTNDDLNKYGQDLICLIKFLKQYSNKIIIESIFDSVVKKHPLLCKLQIKFPLFNDCLRLFSYKEIYDDIINNITNQKSILSEKIAKKNGCKYIDINEYMRQRNYYHIDHIHFENKAKSTIVQFMMKYI